MELQLLDSPLIANIYCVEQIMDNYLYFNQIEVLS